MVFFQSSELHPKHPLSVKKWCRHTFDCPRRPWGRPSKTVAFLFYLYHQRSFPESCVDIQSPIHLPLQLPTTLSVSYWNLRRIPPTILRNQLDKSLSDLNLHADNEGCDLNEGFLSKIQVLQHPCTINFQSPGWTLTHLYLRSILGGDLVSRWFERACDLSRSKQPKFRPIECLDKSMMVLDIFATVKASPL